MATGVLVLRVLRGTVKEVRDLLADKHNPQPHVVRCPCGNLRLNTEMVGGHCSWRCAARKERGGV